MVTANNHAERQTDQVLFVQIRRRPFCRRSYGVPTAACRQQQQQQDENENETSQAPMPADSSGDVSGVRTHYYKLTNTVVAKKNFK